MKRKLLKLLLTVFCGVLCLFGVSACEQLGQLNKDIDYSTSVVKHIKLKDFLIMKDLDN